MSSQTQRIKSKLDPVQLQEWKAQTGLSSTMDKLDRPSIFWVHAYKKYQPGLYVSPHRTWMFDTPNNDALDPRNPWFAWYPQDARIQTAWMSLTPTRMTFEGFLEPLATINIKSNFSEDGSRIEHGLSNATAWRDVAHKLEAIEKAMVEIGVYTHLDTGFLALPDGNMLRSVHSSSKEAKKYFRKVQMRFLVFIAKLTYAGFTMRSRKMPWTDAVIQQGRLPPDLAADLQFSPIAQNCYRDGTPILRVGMVVNTLTLKDREWAAELEAMVAMYTMPVWFFYGTRSWCPSLEWCATYCPPGTSVEACQKAPRDADEVSKLLSGTSEIYQATSHSTTAASSATNRNQQHADRTQADRTTRQIPGETLEEFFAAEEEHKLNKIADELPVQRERRQARENLNLSQPMPTRKSRCQVFEWEPELDGGHTRKLVGKSRLREAWEKYAPTQRKYNSVRDEWDLCVDFDPKATLDSDEEWWPGEPMNVDAAPSQTESEAQQPPSYLQSDLHEGSEVRTLSPRVPLPSAPSIGQRVRSAPYPTRQSTHARDRSQSPRRRTRQLNPTSTQRERIPLHQSTHTSQRLTGPHEDPVGMLTSMPPLQVPSAEAESDLEPEADITPLPLETMLSQWYGIFALRSNFVIPADSVGAMLSILLVRQAIGYHADGSSSQFEAQMLFVMSWLTCSADGKANLINQRIISSTVDTAPGSTCKPPRLQPNRQFNINTIWNQRAEVWYIFQRRNEHAVQIDAAWTLAIRDPRAVNLVLRWNGARTCYEIVSWLRIFGIQFKTLLPYRAQRQALLPTSQMPLFKELVPLGLGKRLKTTRFMPRDYNIYVETRNDFLRKPAGRAALLRGGIVWRIARLVLDWNAALDGPSGNHTRLDYFASNNNAYVDDELNEQDTALICGVYHVLPNEDAPKAQSATTSWWPQPETFETSGIWPGYWTPACEKWFQGWLKELGKENIQPRSASEWRENLKHRKKLCNTIKNEVSRLARQSLPDAA